MIIPFGFIGSSGVSFDADAQAFIDATGISDETQEDAINTLVVGLKADSLWTIMHAIYPFVGGTADTHKYNLKDPRDLDAAFRLTWENGGGGSPHTHSANGIQGVTNSFADTYFVEDTHITINSMHLSIYSRTDLDAFVSDMSAQDNASIRSAIIPNLSGNFYGSIHATGGASAHINDSQAMYTVSRNGAGGVDTYRNKVKVAEVKTSVSKVTFPLYISAQNAGGGASLFSLRQLAFATIGDGLSEAQQNDLYDRIQAFQTSLSRQV